MAQWHGQASRISFAIQSMGKASDWPGLVSDFVKVGQLGSVPGKCSDFIRQAGVAVPARMTSVPARNFVKTDILVNQFGTYPYRVNQVYTYYLTHTPEKGADRIWISVYGYPLNRGSHKGLDQGARSATAVLTVKAPSGWRTVTVFNYLNGWNQKINGGSWSWSTAELGLQPGQSLDIQVVLDMGGEAYHDGGWMNENIMGSSGPGVGVSTASCSPGTSGGSYDNFVAYTYYAAVPKSAENTGPREYPWAKIVPYTQYSRGVSPNREISIGGRWPNGVNLANYIKEVIGSSPVDTITLNILQDAIIYNTGGQPGLIADMNQLTFAKRVIVRNYGFLAGGGGMGGYVIDPTDRGTYSKGQDGGDAIVYHANGGVVLELQNHGVIAGAGGGGSAQGTSVDYHQRAGGGGAPFGKGGYADHGGRDGDQWNGGIGGGCTGSGCHGSMKAGKGGNLGQAGGDPNTNGYWWGHGNPGYAIRSSNNTNLAISVRGDMRGPSNA